MTDKPGGHTVNSINKLAASAIVLLSLGGCAGKSVFEPVLETDGKEMIDIYRNALEDGETVDEKLMRRAANESAGEQALEVDHADKASTSTRPAGPTAAELAEASKNRLYKTKPYTKWQGRYYDKKTGHEVTKFQCGVGGKVQSKPCPGGYGEVLTPREINARKKAEELAALEGEVSKGPATAQSIIAAQERWMEEKRRRDAAIENGFVVEEKTNSSLSTPAVSTLAPRQSACSDQDGIYCGYERTARNEIQQLFPRLPNPDILVFVTPHLATRNRVPVPGYTTVLPLYDQVHYAMPGEKPAHE
jgi:conjugative transfer region lipoprotein (TIGR03751 family)